MLTTLATHYSGQQLTCCFKISSLKYLGMTTISIVIVQKYLDRCMRIYCREKPFTERLPCDSPGIVDVFTGRCLETGCCKTTAILVARFEVSARQRVYTPQYIYRMFKKCTHSLIYNNVLLMNISLMVDITEHSSDACLFLDAQTDDHVPDSSDNGKHWIGKQLVHFFFG
jgi:hypothetical protein